MPVHVLNGFMNPFGGSEAEALEIHARVSAFAPAYLWGVSSRLHPVLAARGIRRARNLPGGYPRDGVFVFVGAHWLRRVWTFFARPARVIYVFNTFHPKVLSIVSKPSPRPGWPTPEIVFVSEYQRRTLGVRGGVVHPSPIDIKRFVPAPRRDERRLTVGRLSRDVMDKYNPADFQIFRRLAERGVRVRLMGATKLQDPLLKHPLIELLPEGHEPAEVFLNGLDVFFYRTGAHVETFGRVVLEAMACGLPVVCDRRGGYADHITSGQDGLLFEDSEDAQHALDALLADEGLRVRLGEAARRKLTQMYSPSAVSERIRFYCEATAKAPPIVSAA